ncbi:putative E3 ubiquitin ligase SUD1 [Hibiscus syriacus]|uniref:RING-type E3 ubiquitin transferase n=1 Tax=Hibiscus syriacus TaxID=106335 RepID=A0A6A3C9I9_HIBSY|nr:putative E3 ubiquitin ligase SUD1 [Hibiscus syriacus]
MPVTDTTLSLANITLKNALTAVKNLTPEGQGNSMLSQVAEILNANSSTVGEISSNTSPPFSADVLKGASFEASRLSDVTTLAVGYMFIFSLVFFYLGVVTLIRYTRGEPLTMGRLYGIASIVETIPSLFRQFLAAMRHLMTMIKVAFLLVIELGVFPLMCGWWLDVCTIRMFGKSMSQRVQFFSVSPIASSLVHWVVGIVYMLQISIFVSLLRGVLRNGVLYFLRDPADPNYNPYRDLIDDPVNKHARRVLLSVAVYGSLIVMLVFLPVQLAMKIAPSIFPLDTDMLLFQICIPFSIEQFKLQTTIKSLFHYWFTAVGRTLGLTEFLLPRPGENGGQENANVEPGQQDRPQVVQLGGQEQAMVAFAADDDPNRGLLASGNSNVVEEFHGDERTDSDRYSFVHRIVLLLVVAWMTLLIFNSSLTIVPISLGRALFNSIPLLPITRGIKCNDESWRVKFERVREDCFSRLQDLWVLRETVAHYNEAADSLVCTLRTSPRRVSSARLQFSRLPLCMARMPLLQLPVLLCEEIPCLVHQLHNSVRDDRYLIGRRLHNFGENSEENQRRQGIPRKHRFIIHGELQ